MPAPVTTTILLHLATAKDISLSVFLGEPTEGASRSRETVIAWSNGRWQTTTGNPTRQITCRPNVESQDPGAHHDDSMAKKYTDDQAQL